MTARLCTIAAFAIVLVQCTASVSAQDLSKRQNGNITHFVGTADQINNYDPHDYVPKAYSTVRIVHAVAMSLAYLIIFPIGSILIRVMTYAELIRVHIILQMIGFWIVVAGSAMGIWMAKQIDQLNRYHPIIGMMMLALLCLQPSTEIANAILHKNHPRIKRVGYFHIWLGRGLLIAGAIQGGLGLLFAADFQNAVVDIWPRALYAAVAGTIWVVYLGLGIIYPEFKDSLKAKREAKKHEIETIPMQNIDNHSMRTNSVSQARTQAWAQGAQSPPMHGYQAFPTQSTQSLRSNSMVSVQPGQSLRSNSTFSGSPAQNLRSSSNAWAQGMGGSRLPPSQHPFREGARSPLQRNPTHGSGGGSPMQSYITPAMQGYTNV